jgi:hypothetical protein
VIEEDLRSYYRGFGGDPDAERRVLAALADPPRRNVRAGLAVAGSAGAVAAIALAVAFVPHGSSSDAPAGGGIASTSASPAPTPTVSVSAPPAAVPLTPQVAVQTLTDLLTGQGTVTRPTGRAIANQALAEVLFDDGHGAAQIDIAVTLGASPTNVKGAAPPSGCTPGPDCTTLPDGSQVSSYQTYEYADRADKGSQEWSVSAFRPDGIQVELIEWNAPTPKDSAATRVDPPLTIAQLTTIATSPKWSATVPAATAAADAKLFIPDLLPGQTPSMPGQTPIATGN